MVLCVNNITVDAVYFNDDGYSVHYTAVVCSSGVVYSISYVLSRCVSAMTSWEKTTMVTGLVVKFSLLLGLLYFFVCSLSFLGDAFRLLGGESRPPTRSSSSVL